MTDLTDSLRADFDIISVGQAAFPSIMGKRAFYGQKQDRKNYINSKQGVHISKYNKNRLLYQQRGKLLSCERLERYLNEFLKVKKVRDYCPNGLQVEGKREIRRVVVSVSASFELFEKAAASGADTIIVHHGLLWDKQDRVVRGGFRRRLSFLLEHDMNLFAFHLPLDCHPILGNNALAVQALGLSALRPFGEHNGQLIGFCGRFRRPVSSDGLYDKIRDLYGSQPLHFAYGPKSVSTLGIISGGAQEDIHDAIKEGLDAYVTGEVSEYVMQVAKEAGIHFLAAGHYATERIGIRALGAHVAAKFRLPVEYIDVPVPV